MAISYDDILEFLKDIKPAVESYKGEKVVTYFSPFTELPTLVETTTHKYVVEVTKIVDKDDKDFSNIGSYDINLSYPEKEEKQ